MMGMTWFLMLLAVPLPNVPIHLVTNGMLLPAMWFGARMESPAMAKAEPAVARTEAAVAVPTDKVEIAEPAEPLLDIPGGEVRVCFDREK